MKQLLVTGANGFIGRALAENLQTQSYGVFRSGGEHDITLPDWAKQFDNLGIDHVFHLAGRTFVPDSWKRPGDFYHVNVMGTQNVLDFCRGRKIGMTYVSAYLYGQPARLPIKESDAIEPNNPYAHSKHLAEQLCAFYAAHFSVPVTIIRPFNVFGAGQDEKFLIPFIIRQALGSDSIVVKDLEPKRDYVYLEDLVGAIALSMEKAGGFQVYNVGAGYSLSVREIIEEVLAVLGTRKEYRSEGQVRINEINDVYADIAEIKNRVGWTPKFSFRDGLVAVIEDMRRN